MFLENKSSQLSLVTTLSTEEQVINNLTSKSKIHTNELNHYEIPGYELSELNH